MNNGQLRAFIDRETVKYPWDGRSEITVIDLATGEERDVPADLVPEVRPLLAPPEAGDGWNVFYLATGLSHEDLDRRMNELAPRR